MKNIVKSYFNNKKLEKVLEDKYTSLRAYQNYKEVVESDLNVMLNTEIVDWIDYECVDELKLELNRLDYLIENTQSDIKILLDKLIVVGW